MTAGFGFATIAPLVPRLRDQASALVSSSRLRTIAPPGRSAACPGAARQPEREIATTAPLASRKASALNQKRFRDG